MLYEMQWDTLLSDRNPINSMPEEREQPITQDGFSTSVALLPLGLHHARNRTDRFRSLDVEPPRLSRALQVSQGSRLPAATDQQCRRRLLELEAGQRTPPQLPLPASRWSFVMKRIMTARELGQPAEGTNGCVAVHHIIPLERGTARMRGLSFVVDQ